MKTKLLLFTGGLLILSLFVAGCSVNSQVIRDKLAIPKIELSTTHYDMGDIDPSKGKWTKEFSVKNAGSEVLKIVSVATSCGCTEAEVENNELAPGEQTKLLVTYDPNVHPGLTGAIKRVIYIQSNDPLQKEVELELTGNVISGDESEK